MIQVKVELTYKLKQSLLETDWNGAYLREVEVVLLETSYSGAYLKQIEGGFTWEKLLSSVYQSSSKSRAYLNQVKAELTWI